MPFPSRRDETYANCFPSGDQTASESIPGCVVARLARPETRSTSHTSQFPVVRSIRFAASVLPSGESDGLMYSAPSSFEIVPKVAPRPIEPVPSSTSKRTSRSSEESGEPSPGQRGYLGLVDLQHDSSSGLGQTALRDERLNLASELGLGQRFSQTRSTPAGP